MYAAPVAPVTAPNEVLLRKAKRGDRQARDQLIRQNLPFVYQEAKRFARRCPFLSFDDFVSEGSIGLLRAIKKFQFKHKVKFLTYASWWVRAFMERAMQSQGDTATVPINLRAILQSGRFTREWEALKAKGYNDDRIRRTMCRKRGWTLSVIHGLERILKPGISLHNPVFDNDHDTLQDTIAINQPTQLDQYEESELRLKIKRVIDTIRPALDERELAILDQRLLAHREVTLAELAEDFGIVRERVRQIEMKLKVKLERAFKRDKYIQREVMPAEEPKTAVRKKLKPKTKTKRGNGKRTAKVVGRILHRPGKGRRDTRNVQKKKVRRSRRVA